jgi:hypothetical protein
MRSFASKIAALSRSTLLVSLLAVPGILYAQDSGQGSSDDKSFRTILILIVIGFLISNAVARSSKRKQAGATADSSRTAGANDATARAADQLVTDFRKKWQTEPTSVIAARYRAGSYCKEEIEAMRQLLLERHVPESEFNPEAPSQ